MNEKELNATLQGMNNPMCNLFGVMNNIVCLMGVARYADVLDKLRKAESLMTDALTQAQNITYDCDK